jgi:glycosyltransferase involved in cell wall biosynthesis
MFNGYRIAVVMPAYNAAETLEQVVKELPGIVDFKIVVDDHSLDDTAELAHRLGLRVFVHSSNYGYGRNQKTCYQEALDCGADIIVMVHPDYQYSPLLVTSMVSMIAHGVYDVVIASRIIGGGALKGGMPLYKYIGNRGLTFFQNLLLGAKLSEYHTGYRAFNKETILNLPLASNSDGFVFDNEMLAQCVFFGFRIGEISCPTKYFAEASSIGFWRSVEYGLGVLATSIKFILQKLGLLRFDLFSSTHGMLEKDYYYEFHDRNATQEKPDSEEKSTGAP